MDAAIVTHGYVQKEESGTPLTKDESEVPLQSKLQDDLKNKPMLLYPGWNTLKAGLHGVGLFDPPTTISYIRLPSDEKSIKPSHDTRTCTVGMRRTGLLVVMICTLLLCAGLASLIVFQTIRSDTSDKTTLTATQQPSVDPPSLEHTTIKEVKKSQNTTTTEIMKTTSVKYASTCLPTPTSQPRQPAVVNNISVMCDTETDGGGWVIVMSRTQGGVDFFRDWKQYQEGFGELWGDHWLGLSHIHSLCNERSPCRLRVDMGYTGTPVCDTGCDLAGPAPRRSDGEYFAEYSKFSIADERDDFRLRVSGYSGNAGDSLSYNNGRPFSTHDRDNDAWPGTNCAVGRHAAWWYSYCGVASLTGVWEARDGTGLWWWALTGYYTSVDRAEVKVKPL